MMNYKMSNQLNLFKIKKEKKAVLLNLDADLVKRLDVLAKNEKVKRTELIQAILLKFLQTDLK